VIATGKLRPLDLNALQRVHLIINVCHRHRKQRTIQYQAACELFEVSLAVSPFVLQLSNLLLLARQLAALGLADLATTIDSDSRSGALLLSLLWVVVHPAVAARHVVPAVVGATEAVAGHRSVAGWIVAE
jgi:hypothetical protein